MARKAAALLLLLLYIKHQTPRTPHRPSYQFGSSHASKTSQQTRRLSGYPPSEDQHCRVAMCWKSGYYYTTCQHLYPRYQLCRDGRRNEALEPVCPNGITPLESSEFKRCCSAACCTASVSAFLQRWAQSIKNNDGQTSQRSNQLGAAAIQSHMAHKALCKPAGPRPWGDMRAQALRDAGIDPAGILGI